MILLYSFPKAAIIKYHELPSSRHHRWIVLLLPRQEAESRDWGSPPQSEAWRKGLASFSLLVDAATLGVPWLAAVQEKS